MGFPIACAVAMFVLLNNEQKNHKTEEEELNKALTEMKMSFSDALNNQQKEITQAINNNTIVMQKLVDKLGGEDGFK